MTPRIRLGLSAKPWHDCSDIKAYNDEFFSPQFQKQFPDGKLPLCSAIPEGQWIYRDCSTDKEWVIYAAAAPPYNTILCEKMMASDDVDPHGSVIADTGYYVADHHFEPVDNAQEIRDSLPADATLQDAVQALFRTCKGCAKYVKDAESKAKTE